MPRLSSQVLLAITLVLIAAGILMLSLAGYVQPFQSAALQPVGAIQSWLSIRYSAISDLIASPRDLSAMRGRVSELEAENARLQQELVSLREQVAEIDTLRALVSFAQAQPESRYLGAAVIGRDTSPFLQSVWINAGSDDGLAKGMPVVTDRGLVGRVAEVFASVARVQLLSDPELAVNVLLQNSRSDGVLEAQINGELRVNLIDQDTVVDEGELVLTSGLGGSYPVDIPVGEVISVRKRDFELFQQAIIQPSVDPQDIELVLVITNFQPLPFGDELP